MITENRSASGSWNRPEHKTVLVCDTQPVAIEGIRGLLEHSETLRFAGGVSSLEAAGELIHVMAPVLVIVDKAFGMRAIMDWLRSLLATGSSSAVVVWGVAINEAEALRLLQGGARGVLRRTSDPETLVTCLRAVSSGNSWMEQGIFDEPEKTPAARSQLTPREAEVARLVEQGLRNRDIADHLGIRIGTVKIHLRHIFEKTGVRGRYSLALNGLREKGAFAAAHM
jgi:two-component system, NarL family, nitrate/nitrite response regulator NarL